MEVYIGVDFHPHQQTVAWCDKETGETGTVTLRHDLEKVKEFYASFPKPAVIGIEASSRALWFENMIDGMDHKLLVGNPEKIRKRALSRHKNDRRDAELILTLLLRDEFPAIWRRSPEANQIMDVLRLRQKLVRGRTSIYNRLQALAHTVCLPKGRMRTLYYQQMLREAEMDEGGELQRSHLFELLEDHNRHISELERWLKSKAMSNDRVKLLRTQRGVGYLTGLAVVNLLEDVSRFDKVPKQVTNFVGYDCLDRSSGARTRFGSISKKGSPLARFLLGQSAMSAIKWDPRLKAFYRRLRKRKPASVAKVATARKLLVKLSIMLRDNIDADEFDRRGRAVGNAREARGLK